MTNVQMWDGKPITQDCAVFDLPIEQYHSPICGPYPDISSSGLRQITTNPALYWAHSYHNPAGRPKASTEPMNMGRAAHHLLLGEEDFSEYFVVRPSHLGVDKDGDPWAWSGNRTDCKAWLREAADAGLTVLTEAAMEKIKGMAEALDAHPIAADFLRGRIETSLFHFVDVEVQADSFAEVGEGKRVVRVGLKARPDAVPKHDSVLADLKCPKGGGADPEKVRRSMTDMGYPMQLGLGAMVWKAVTGQSIEAAVLVNVEQEWPHPVSVVEIGRDTLWNGARECMAAVRTFAECWATGDWPGYAGDGQTVEYPDYKRKRLEQQEAAGLLPMLEGDAL